MHILSAIKQLLLKFELSTSQATVTKEVTNNAEIVKQLGRHAHAQETASKKVIALQGNVSSLVMRQDAD